ncbi:MAG: hypothetical protein HRU12_08065 [Phaeodactylibacter sp.]|nr:hypothetical protein [Phaeodactylibacter sp.]
MANNFPAPAKTVADLFLDTAGWTYDGSSWSNPPVTPQASASFSATSPSATLGTDGIVSWFSNTRVNEEIPNSGGLRGWRWRHNAKPNPNDDSTSETRYSLLVPQSDCYEYFKMWHPSNFAHRAFFTATANAPASDFSDWQVGDTITRGTATATVGYVRDTGSKTEFFFKDCSINYTEGMFPVGETVTNDNGTRTNPSFVIESRNNPPSNNKFSSMWVDDGGAGQGYENGAFTVQTIGTPVANSFNPSARLIPGLAAGSSQSAVGQLSNQLSGAADPLLMFDVANNGSVAEVVIRRKRSASGVSDGGYQIWVKNADYSNWTLVYENLSRETFSSSSDNKFTHGYWNGYANSGYEQTTDFYLMEWQLWTQKPTFLP